MAYLKLADACLAYGHVPLLDHTDFMLDPGERVALIGRNGTGKSSLLAALAAGSGRGKLDDGEVWVQPGIRVGYVPQEPPFDMDMTVFEAVVSGMGETSKILAAYHEVVHHLAEGTGDQDALLAEMETLQHELEARGAWAYEAQAEKVIDRFGLDPEANVGSLSGGQKKRLALAQALAVAPEVLLLDEPTNHLDIAAIEWLENLLIETGTTLFFITHDRSFLNRVCTRIVELDRGKLVSFPGTFAEYQTRKEALLHEEGLANARADKLLKEEEIWIRKGVEARRTRAVFRVQRLDILRAERQARRERMGKVNLQLDSGDKSGKLVSELEHVSKSYGQRPKEAKNERWSDKLSDREKQVARLVASGSSNKEVAATLNIAERTVKAHMTAIFEKLELRDRLQLSLNLILTTSVKNTLRDLLCQMAGKLFANQLMRMQQGQAKMI